MSWINRDDVEQQLIGAGLVLDRELNFDGAYQRWKVNGEDNEKRGWSRLREWTSKAGHRYIVGYYGVWHGADDGYTKIELPKRDEPSRPTLTDDDIAAMRAAQKEANRKIAEKRKAEAKQAGRWAAQVWAHCTPAPADHEYLVRKQIRAHGTRIMAETEGLMLSGLDDSNYYRLKMAAGALVVPMHDENGNVCGIQFIYPRGHARAQKIERDKEFWPSGMAMGGTFGLIGPAKRDGIILIDEGFATAASLHEATGQTVAYAFSANNLVKAGKLLRKTCRSARLLFCADDDYLWKCSDKPEGGEKCGHVNNEIRDTCEKCGAERKGPANPGCHYAAQATAEIENSAWTKPDFLDEDGADRRNGKKLTDYNDLAILTGLPLVLANQINAKLDALKWRDATSARGALNTGGGDGGGDGGGRRRAEAVMALDEIVARFIPLDDGTGKFVFDTWTNKVAHREQMVALLPAGVRGDDVKRHPVWIERGAYFLDEVGFDPSGKDRIVKLNTWKGWPMQPKKGCCDALLSLLHYLCSGDPDGDKLFDWVLKWMAYPLQHPGAKMASAIIMHGPQGTGKSTVWQCLAKIYGDYATVLNQRGLEDRFNSDWVDSKLFLLAEEVVTRAEMWHIKNELKELITGEWIRVNPKNIAAYRQRNQVNGVFLSNENQPLPLDNDDRRHCVIYTPPALSESEYDEVFLEIENGGIEALYHYLLELDLADFHPKKRPPMTEAKQALIDLSSPSETRFVRDWISGDLGLPICPALSTDVYAAYHRYCRQRGEMRPRPDNQFFGSLMRMPGWGKKKARHYADYHYTGDTISRPVVFPPPASIVDKNYEQTPGMSISAWVTNGVLGFASALSEGNSALKVAA